MKIIKVTKDTNIRQTLSEVLDRTENPNPEIEKSVADILHNVSVKGDEALAYYTKGFDRATVKELKVSEEEIQEAIEIVGEEFMEILREAYANVYSFHEAQLEQSWMREFRKGVMLGQRITPIGRVGLYVPGGTAAYPSTVIMTAVPAVVAGVKSIAMVTPPSQDGKANPSVLAAASICGITEIYKVGGAQAIAALTYGTKTIQPVNKIVGPGNIYVATAKRQVFGLVGIDMIAGPSEIGILADAGANPKHIAADLLSQAEHDPRAACILVTTSEDLAKKVQMEVFMQVKQLERLSIAEEALANYGLIFVVRSKKMAIEWMNEIAPEHLEILFENPEEYLDEVENAGSIFLGEYTPEPLGDYFAGPNHTLPTSGTAKFSSPLGVYDYTKRSGILRYDRDAFIEVADKVGTFAVREGLTGHKQAIEVRKE
ncbi:MAG: histidinol dehydrogenase [Tissierellia bacterium]|nr:histidinol dehydrogenase [Tissierellia bacterium]